MKARKRHGFAKLSILLLVCVAALGVVLSMTPAQRGEAAPGVVDQTERYTYADLADEVLPSIVTVYVKQEAPKADDNAMKEQLEEFRRFFGDIPFEIPDMPQPRERRGSGSGIVISEDGYILTNHHVVGWADESAEITVVFHDESEVTGEAVKVIDSREFSDLAVLKVDKKGLKPATWGDSTELRIGERIASIGSPLDLRQTVTQGIVCAKTRDFARGLGGLIQTDAVINPGSSGGALVNLDGKLVGVNRLITTNTGAWQGYGFAIPSNTARSFAEEVMREGKKRYGFIGITMNEREDTPELRQSLWLPEDENGVMVIGVTKDAPAEQAGIQANDLILTVDGVPVKKPQDMINYIAEVNVGEEVEVELLRPTYSEKPKRMKIDMEVGERPTERELMQAMRDNRGPRQPGKETPEPAFGDLGMVLEEHEEEGEKALKVLEIEKDSAAAKAGLRPGDLLLQMNGIELEDDRDLLKAIKRQSEGRPHNVVVRRQGMERRMIIENPEQE